MLENPQFKDFDEGGHTFRMQTPMHRQGNGPWPQIVSSTMMRKRRLPNVWVLSGTSSLISKAKKLYTVRIEPVIEFTRQLSFSIEKKYGRKLPIFFGPVSYIDEINNSIVHDEQPMYFSKSAKYKDGLEFRIVIYPPHEIDNIEPETFILPEPNRIFSKTISI